MDIQDLGKTIQPIHQEIVISLYKSLSPHCSEEQIKQTIKEFSVWRLKPWNDELANRAIIWYEGSCLPRNHPSHLFTNQGRTQKLKEAARNWPAVSQNYPDSSYVKNIRNIIKALETKVSLPPLIAITGRMNKSVHILDGNTRALAAEILRLERPGFIPRLEVLMGRKSFFG
jgi:hypothetical protein